MQLKIFKEKVRLAYLENGDNDYIPTKMIHLVGVVEEIEALELRLEKMSKLLAQTQCSLATHLNGRPKPLEKYYA